MNESAGGRKEPPAGRPDVVRPMASWMQEIVPFGIFTTDFDLRVTTWNDWLVNHSGLAAHEVIGQHLWELFPDMEARRVKDRYSRALGGEVSVLSTALHKYLLPFPSTVPESGLPHMLQTARVAPLPEGQKIAGTITVIEDVTQREFQANILGRQQGIDRLLSSALATLLQSEDPVEEMAGIYGSVRLALGLDGYAGYLMTPDGKGLRLHTSTGISPKHREAAAYLPLSVEQHDLLNAAGDEEPTELARNDALDTLGFRAQCALPLAVGGRVIGLAVFGSYERTAIAPPDLKILSRIARYVAIALDRARRQRETTSASRAKDDFLAALSHELRTPLNPILLIASDAAANPAYPAEAKDEFKTIEKNALIEARLIDDLLDVTRIAHGKMTIELANVDLRTVVAEALEMLRADTVERAIVVDCDLGPAELPVLGDAARLLQVFWNVIKNSIKFTSPGGSISVRATKHTEANEAIVEVVDTGIGMTPTELTRIFAAFSQGDHAEHGAHRFGGLGLGLAISQELVELHSGQISAKSEGKNRGSTFTISLPLLNTPTRSPLLPAASVPGQRPSPSRPPFGAERRILLVEDHETTRLTLLRLLEARGYLVTGAATADAALHAAAQGRFDLVLSDIGLPDEDGFSLMRKLRERHGLRGIALTGYGMEEDQIQSGDAGFFAHVTKPISIQTLDRILVEAFPPR